MRSRATRVLSRSKLFAYGTTVVLGGLRVKKACLRVLMYKAEGVSGITYACVYVTGNTCNQGFHEIPKIQGFHVIPKLVSDYVLSLKYTMDYT